MTSVKRLYIYNPNFQVPKSMWQVLMDKLPGQVFKGHCSSSFISFTVHITYKNGNNMLFLLVVYFRFPLSRTLVLNSDNFMQNKT